MTSASICAVCRPTFLADQSKITTMPLARTPQAVSCGWRCTHARILSNFTSSYIGRKTRSLRSFFSNA